MNCKICNQEFDSKSLLACHIRWKHPKKNNWIQCKFCRDMYQTANISQHLKGCRMNPKNIRKCLECGNDTNNNKFCDRNCATLFNNKASKTGFKRQMMDNKHPNVIKAEYKDTLHRRICKKYWDMKCPICGWDKSVDVHHIDENNENNTPRNLIPLCQNHHTLTRMLKHKDEIDKRIKDLVKERFGDID